MSTEKSESLKKIGAAIREARKRKNLKLRQVAAEAGCTPGNLSSIERGAWGSSRSLAVHLERILGLREEFLTTGIEPRYKDDLAADPAAAYGDMEIDPKRVDLVNKVKELMHKADDETVDALLKNVEQFSRIPPKKREE